MNTVTHHIEMTEDTKGIYLMLAVIFVITAAFLVMYILVPLLYAAGQEKSHSISTKTTNTSIANYERR